jgi:hypothetical protein
MARNLHDGGETVSTPEMEYKLRSAAARGDCGAIRLLAMSGVDLEARDERGRSAFNLATQNCHHEAALTILAAREVRFMRRIGVSPEEYLTRRNVASGLRPEAGESMLSSSRKA